MGKSQDLNIINYALMKKRTDQLQHDLDDAIVGIFKPGGSCTFENLPTLSADVLGYVYTVTDDFTTDSRFVEGAGYDYEAGTNVAVVDTGDVGSHVYKFDVRTNAIVVDTTLSTVSENPVQNKVITTRIQADETTIATKQGKTLDTPIVVDGITQTTVEGTLGALNAKSVSVDDALSTQSANPVENRVVTTAINGKQDTLQWDTVPTENSTKSVNSGNIFNAIEHHVPVFTGTRTEWNTLSNAEKAEYDIVNLTDDLGNSNSVVNIVQDGNMNPVTSNAVYNAIQSGGGSGIVVDTEMDETSTNPVQNKVITEAINGFQTQELITPITVDGEQKTTVETALQAINSKATHVEVDDAISPTSTNAVQNRAIYNALQGQEVSYQTCLNDWKAVFGDEGVGDNDLVMVSPTIFDSSDVTVDSL